MDLDFTEEQEMLREMVRAVCVEHSPVDVVRAMEDDPVGFPKALWEKLAEVEVHGILIPESYGGSGMSILDAEVVYEEFGRALAPIPHFVSCVLSASALLAAGTEDQKKAWLPKIASGEAILTPAWLEPKNGKRFAFEITMDDEVIGYMMREDVGGKRVEFWTLDQGVYLDGLLESGQRIWFRSTKACGATVAEFHQACGLEQSFKTKPGVTEVGADFL